MAARTSPVSGPIGHAAEMAKAGNVTLELYAERIPIFDRALNSPPTESFRQAPTTTCPYLEKDVMDYTIRVPQERLDCLYDPQTSGGLLIACKKNELERLQYQLGEKGCQNAAIGRFKRTSHAIEILNK